MATSFSHSLHAETADQVGVMRSSAGSKEIRLDTTLNARQIVSAIPAEFLRERFEANDTKGHTIAYMAFTEGDIGGLIFVENKLTAQVSKQDAMAFYSCRGYATAVQHHWAKDADIWAETLLQASVPVSDVDLHFTGKSGLRSIVEVVNDPTLSQVSSLVDMGTNPLSIFRKLSSAWDSSVDRDHFQKTLLRLKNVLTGASEAEVAEIIKPEDVSFVSGGLVMAYPRFSLEYFVSNGVVKVVQQPSFYHLSRTQAALFYAPNVRWELCTPTEWRKAMPEVIMPDSATKK
ncbi:hypothetical protein KDM87_13075 [Undibacterium sp. FT147W]|uniref:Uncharacterized protein n=1 Tax=Undibacterium rivi TaxID=2828729 RepID=A0ABS5H4Q4_9BURK|nr:hypothetical protein [Undibacterium rivi]MBR7793532.1 hypothetical protein [Undibacterium rivi]